MPKGTLIYLNFGAEVDSLKSDQSYGSTFAQFDLSNGINYQSVSVKNCPKHVINTYSLLSYVHFAVFFKFSQNLSRLRNDSSYQQVLDTQNQIAQKSGQKMDIHLH